MRIQNAAPVETVPCSWQRYGKGQVRAIILYFSGHLRQKQNCIYAAETVCGTLETLPATSTQNLLFTKYVVTSTIVTRDQTAESTVTISTDYMIATKSANRMRSSYEASL